MEQSSQHLPPDHNQQSPTPPVIELQGAAATSSAPIAVDIGGNQPNNTVTSAAEPTGDHPTPPLPNITKKRKANASGPRRTSSAWEHFTKLPESEGKQSQASCNYCKKTYYCDTKTHGTSNMLARLKTCSKYTHAINNDPNQRILSFGPGRGAEDSVLGASSQRFNVEACKKALALFVTLDEQPFKAIEGEGFKLLCKQLQPQFSVPSRQTVARNIYQLYLDEKIRLKTFFRSDCTHVALTTDCWTSIQNLNYLALTAHFIDNNWNYHKRIISFSIVPNHKGETIGMRVEEALREWGLRNVSTITVDNASSNDVAVSYLKNRIKDFNGLVLNGQFFHMRCCAHILNLVVNDGLKDIDPSISNIRNAVRFVRSSPQRFAKFKECIEFSNISCKKLVCLDVPTRWNSTYLMLEAAEKFQAAFEKLAFEETSYPEYFGTSSPPSSEDWEKARVFVKFLKIFYDATKSFSASVHVTIHSAFHQLALIHCELKQSSMNLNSIFAHMGLEMKRKYDKYWGNALNINQLLYFGVILDPRYKLRYVEWSFSDMYQQHDTNFSNALSISVKDNLSRMYSWYAAIHEQQNMTAQSSHNSLQGSSRETACQSEIATYVARTDAFKHLRDKNSIDQKNELERYLAESCVDGDDKFDLLIWWKQNCSRFPILSAMARDVLATPVSTVASESAFSTGGRVLDMFRSSLRPEMAEALICAQNWLKPSINQVKDLNVNEDLEISEKVLIELQGEPTAFGRGARVGSSTGQVSSS